MSPLILLEVDTQHVAHDVPVAKVTTSRVHVSGVCW